MLRWNHPVHGQISPGVCIPILEENGRIEDVTDWVIRQVCKQIHRWFMGNQLSIKVSVNIPGPYLTSPRLMEVLEKSVTTYNVNSGDLELEVTESSVMTNIDGVPESDKDSNIMKSMITLARSLDLEIVIEGVETGEQMQFL